VAALFTTVLTIVLTILLIMCVFSYVDIVSDEPDDFSQTKPSSTEADLSEEQRFVSLACKTRVTTAPR